MRKASSKGRAILVFLLVLSLVFSGAALTMEIVEKVDASHAQDQYTLYIGTNDKDTGIPEIPFDECRTRVEDACLQYVSGFTITEAGGAWTDDAGNVANEKTLVCRINGASEADINAIADRLLTELNQSSIMIEHQKISYTYHSR